MKDLKNFISEYRGSIIGIIIAILIWFTGFYKLVIAIIFIFVGAFVGNYIQKNKFVVKEKLKEFIDKL